MRTLFLSLTSLAVSGFLTSAMATSYAPPQDKEVKSANGKYTLKITAKTGEHRVFVGNKELWSFKRDVWHHETFLSNDGAHVVWVAWRHVKDESTAKGEAIAAYSAEGKVVSKGRTLAVSEARLMDANGKLLAIGTETCAIFPIANLAAR